MNKPLRQLTVLEKFGLPAIVACIALYAYLKLVYDPKMAEFARLNQEMGTTIRQVNELRGADLAGKKQAMDRLLEVSKKQMAAAEVDLAEMRKVIATNDNERSEMLREMSQVAESKYGIKIKESKPVAQQSRPGGAQEAEAESLLSGMSHYSMVIIGDFFSLNQFFKDTSRIKGKLVIIDKLVEMTKSMEATEKCRAVVEFSL